MKRQEQMILTARIVSMLFTPFYLPILGLATLFMFSYLSMFPLIYKIQVLALTYLFTILLPTLLIHLYRRYQGWNLIELGQRICALINIWWKISTHTAAIGGVGGALFAFSFYLGFNPVWWLCLVFLTAGILGSCRMILRQHNLAQVVVGFWVGGFCAATAILLF